MYENTDKLQHLALDFNDIFCCVPCHSVATWKVAICLYFVSDKGNEHNKMARCWTKTHWETTNMAADHWARSLYLQLSRLAAGKLDRTQRTPSGQRK